MNEKHKRYQFVFLEQHTMSFLISDGLSAPKDEVNFGEFRPFDPNNEGDSLKFNERLIELGQNGWGIVSVDYMERDGKTYKTVALQREILD